jgi:phosphoribosylanthranilate isomerase
MKEIAPHSLPSLLRPWIKVCGIRSLADLDMCAAAGATHAGFNTWPRSPRHVEAARVASLVEGARERGLVPVILSVPGSLLPNRDAGGLGAWLQIAAPPGEGEREGFLGILEARAADPATVAGPAWGDALLLDARAGDLPGGTGRPVSLDLALRAPRPFILAGGLTPENVGERVAEMAPAGVDAASGLESAPGVKDPGRIRAFCAAARLAFQRHPAPLHGEAVRR